MSEDERKAFRAGNGGALNPDWVEWLMGWPVGWTSLMPLDCRKYYKWLSGYNREPSEKITQTKENRTPRLKAIGNGQVPQAAASAWCLLGGRS